MTNNLKIDNEVTAPSTTRYTECPSVKVVLSVSETQLFPYTVHCTDEQHAMFSYEFQISRWIFRK
jgi:hypothetical protein